MAFARRSILAAVALSTYCCMAAMAKVHNVGDILFEPPRVDLTQDDSSVVLYVRLCEWSVTDGNFTIASMTRHCYCTDAVDEDSCSVPGPTLVMHDQRHINVTIVNLLSGSEVVYGTGSAYWNAYKDMDTTNLHVHGLHVSPDVDTVLSHIHPNGGSLSYPYEIGYHHPGTHWYHAHHHGAATLQIDAGLHGALLMQADGDDTDKYDENVLTFQWLYVIPSSICNPEGRGCPGASYNGDQFEHTERFLLDDAAQDENIEAFYVTCDIYCAMPPEQRLNSGYIYDVATDLQTSHLANGGVDHNLIYFFVNGQLEPVIELTKGVFRRLRLINSISNYYLQLRFPSECQWYLVATDGHFIDNQYMNFDLSAESHQNEVLIASGSRNDIMVKCDVTGRFDIAASEANHDDPTLHTFQRVYDGLVMFSIEVNDASEAVTDGTDGLPSAYPAKPLGSYVQDTMDIEPVTECECNYKDPTNTDCRFDWGWNHGPAVNDKTFNISGTTPYYEDSLTFIRYNELYEFIINNGQTPHIYHQHTFPFQNQNAIGNNGFIALPGTWWDTLGNQPTQGQFIYGRFWTRDYYGLIIAHCHLLMHEDHGMMGYFHVLPPGEELPDECPNAQSDPGPGGPGEGPGPSPQTTADTAPEMFSTTELAVETSEGTASSTTGGDGTDSAPSSTLSAAALTAMLFLFLCNFV